MARPRALRTPPARGTSTVCDAELLGEGAGVHPAGAAEGEEGEVPGVEAALDADHAQRPHHLRVRHPHDPERRLLRVQAELLAQGGEGLLRELSLQHDLSAELRPVGEVAEEEVGVGDGWLLAALVVGGGAGLGAGRVGADAQGAAGVGPGDRAAAGAHGVHVDHGQLYGDARDDRLRGRLGLALDDRAPRPCECRPCRRSGGPW